MQEAKGAGIGSAIGGGVSYITGGILSSVGFTSSGVAAGSCAAGIQSGIGNIVAGSLFATAPIIAIGGAIIGGYFFWKK